MTISELVAKLEAVRAEHGDLPVWVFDDWDDFPMHKTQPAILVEADSPDDQCDPPRPKRVVLQSIQGMF